MVSDLRSTASLSEVTSPRQRTAKPGPGNGCRASRDGRTALTQKIYFEKIESLKTILLEDYLPEAIRKILG